MLKTAVFFSTAKIKKKKERKRKGKRLVNEIFCPKAKTHVY